MVSASKITIPVGAGDDGGGRGIPGIPPGAARKHGAPAPSFVSGYTLADGELRRRPGPRFRRGHAGRAMALVWLGALLIAVVPGASGEELAAPPATRAPDVGYVPNPQPIVDAMLKLASVQRGEVVYDLGCGDGRAVVTAARDFGARGIGVDIDPARIAESVANAASAGVSDRVRFEQADLFRMSFNDADVLFLYLLPQLNARLRPRILDELRPGTRVVSHAFAMGEWAPDRISHVGNIPIFFWIVPAKVDGDWEVTLAGGARGSLSLRQQFQYVTGTLTIGARAMPLRDARISGSTFAFRYSSGWRNPRAYAVVAHGRLTGTIEHGWLRRPESWTAERR